MENTKIFYGDVRIDTESFEDSSTNYPIELMYYKTRNSRSNFINEEYEVYGVEVIKKEYRDDNVYTESMRVEDITKNEETVDKVIEMLKSNSVTPVTLNDVICDMFY